jgi:hypothetical protein
MGPLALLSPARLRTESATVRNLDANTALGTCRPGSKDEDAKKKGRPNDDDAQHGPDLVRDSRPDACVIGLAHASSVVLRRSGPHGYVILFKIKIIYIYIYITKSLDVYCGFRGRTLFVLLLAHLDKSGTIRVFQEKRIAQWMKGVVCKS